MFGGCVQTHYIYHNECDQSLQPGTKSSEPVAFQADAEAWEDSQFAIWLLQKHPSPLRFQSDGLHVHSMHIENLYCSN